MSASVEFHTGVADPIGFACRLLRKAYRSGARVLVTAPEGDLAALDKALWTLSDADFIPHVRLPAADAMRARTPILLAASIAERSAVSEAPRVLVNLGAEAPAQATDFDRIIEIVGSAPELAAAGRERWRHYESWGVQPLHHDSK